MKFPFLHLPTAEALKWRAYYEAEGSATYSEPRGAEPMHTLDHNVVMQAGKPIIWIDPATQDRVTVPDVFIPAIRYQAVHNQTSIELETHRLMEEQCGRFASSVQRRRPRTAAEVAMRLQEHEEQMRRLAKGLLPKPEGALIDYDTHMPLTPEFIARCKKAAQLVFGKEKEEEE